MLTAHAQNTHSDNTDIGDNINTIIPLIDDWIKYQNMLIINIIKNGMLNNDNRECILFCIIGVLL